jgi:hypothetical protein
VIDWVRDDTGAPTERLLIEAVLTNRVRQVHRRDLEDTESWRIGWV